MIADTSFIIDLMIGEKAAISKAKEIEDKNIPLSLSAPTLFELYVGISLSHKREEEKARVLNVIDSMPFLPLDIESTKAGGQIYAEKSRVGLRIDPEDAMIAGIARVNGEKVLTRNLKHLQDIPGVNLEKY